MPTTTSKARWNGSIGDGSGEMTIGKGIWTGAFDVPSRFEKDDSTNPEQLIAAAHAGCYSMALSAGLTRGGHDVTSIDTSADVTITKGDAGWSITKIVLTTVADVPGISDEDFQAAAADAKANCPVSKALAGVDTIELNASLQA